MPGALRLFRLATLEQVALQTFARVWFCIPADVMRSWLKVLPFPRCEEGSARGDCALRSARPYVPVSFPCVH